MTTDYRTVRAQPHGTPAIMDLASQLVLLLTDRPQTARDLAARIDQPFHPVFSALKILVKGARANQELVRGLGNKGRPPWGFTVALGFPPIPRYSRRTQWHG